MRKLSNKRIGEYMQTVLKIIIENDDSCPVRQIKEEMEKRLTFSQYEKEVYQKSGYIRWQSMMHFYSIGLVKAGWLRKYKGSWYITDEGKKKLELDPEEFIKEAEKRYLEWANSRQLIRSEKHNEVQEPIATSYEQAQNASQEEIKDFIKKLNPYDFQDLVAALFRGMGYHTPFVAPKGPDGGIDIVAYKDPIGAELPRIRIQVKHRIDTKVGRAEVASLNSDLQKEGYIGIIVSSGGFSKDALNEIRKTNKHIEKIDLEDFIDLWKKHYKKLSDEDRNLLPLREISFLAPEG